MELIGLLLMLFLRSFLLVIPLAVALLAFRRLARSETQNAWLYAAVGLLAAFTVIGLLPWAVGLGRANWLFFVFAAFSPALWLGVVALCAPYSQAPYDAPSAFDAEETEGSDSPLILEKPDWPDAPVVTFRHRTSKSPDTEPQDDGNRSILAVARDMRGRKSSDKRRGPALLPPPNGGSLDLPFLR